MGHWYARGNWDKLLCEADSKEELLDKLAQFDAMPDVEHVAYVADGEDVDCIVLARSERITFNQVLERLWLVRDRVASRQEMSGTGLNGDRV